MSVIEKRIELLKEESRKLSSLLADPHPGLSSWLSFVWDVRCEIVAIMDGERDE